MNRSSIITLLRRREVAWDLPHVHDNDLIDEWHRLLQHVGDQDAFAALDRLVGREKRPPSPARILSEIHDRKSATTPPPAAGPVKPLGRDGCELCDGTGFMYVRDPGDPTLRAAPCSTCRPEHPWHKRRATAPAPVQAIGDSIMDGAAERLAAWRSGDRDSYAAVLRRQFPDAGTRTRAPLSESDIRDRMRSIPPLAGYGSRRPPDEPA